MSHRGPRQQRFPSVNGVSSNRSDHQSRQAQQSNGYSRPTTAPSWRRVYEELHKHCFVRLGPHNAARIGSLYPLTKYPADVAEYAFAEARDIDMRSAPDTTPVNQEQSNNELLDSLTQCAYYHVRAIADQIMREVEER